MKAAKHLDLTNKRKITSGTREWADYNVNVIKGCYNDCRYCYAKMMAKRFGRATEKSWKIMKIRREKIAKTYRKLNGRVMFPSSHDLFDFPQIEEACFEVLEKLLESGNDVLVTTKPRFKVIRKIEKLFSHYNGHLQFRFTITSNNNGLIRFWEPNAPLFQERMDSLKYAFENGFRTSVSIEPFLDYNPRPLVEAVADYSTESIWIGKMNYIPRKSISENEVPFYDGIRKNYEINHLRNIYDKLKDFPRIKFKDSIRNKLAF